MLRGGVARGWRRWGLAAGYSGGARRRGRAREEREAARRGRLGRHRSKRGGTGEGVARWRGVSVGGDWAESGWRWLKGAAGGGVGSALAVAGRRG